MENTEDLKDYIDRKLAEDLTYDSSPEILADVALAAFNYAAAHMGVTGFQASWAELDFIRKSRRLDCPFAIIKADKLLYPQYNLHQEVDELIDSWCNWASEEAKKNLANEEKMKYASPYVIARWELLAEE